MQKYDIVIIGAGIVGATTALALAKNSSLSIAILDSKPIEANWESEKFHHRVSTLSLASKRIFQRLNVWNKITEKRWTPYTHMYVWEEKGNSKIEFDAEESNTPALGFIVEDNVIRKSLYEIIDHHPAIHLVSPVNLVSLNRVEKGIEITSEKESFITKLVIAADGANSWSRKQMGIEVETFSYDQSAIVSTVKTTLPHQNTAWQRFLTNGVLAFLPLSEPYTSSIVWSAHPDYVKELISQDKQQFKESLTAAFETKLGKIIECDKLYSFPLQMTHVKNYIQNRFALVGDAAHTMHPLAGQGVNMGLLDAASLAQVILESFHKQQDFSSIAKLRQYERWRKSDNQIMLTMVNTIKKVFMNEKPIYQSIRNLGLSVANIGFIKKFLTSYALGNKDDLPDLAK